VFRCGLVTKKKPLRHKNTKKKIIKILNLKTLVAPKEKIVRRPWHYSSLQLMGALYAWLQNCQQNTTIPFTPVY